MRSATDFCLPEIRILMSFAPTVLVSYATLMIVVNIAMIALTRDGRRFLLIMRSWLFRMRRGGGRLVLNLPKSSS